MASPPAILFCHCAYSDAIDAGRRREVFQALSASGVAFAATPDLCAMAARRDPALHRIAQAPAARIVACHERAVRALFDAAGAPLGAEGVEVLNMRATDARAILRSLLGPGAETIELPPAPPAPPQPSGEEWVPWFPVIDRDRCGNCKQCLNFCLFGVYATDEDDRVFVANPANCKTNCPACARICPEAAIVFPKHDQAPINGGPPEKAEPGAGPVKVDVAEVLRGDVYAVLRRRQGRSGPAGRPACSCAAGGPAEELGIPPEVLAASPRLRAALEKWRESPAGEGDEPRHEDS